MATADSTIGKAGNGWKCRWVDNSFKNFEKKKNPGSSLESYIES